VKNLQDRVVRTSIQRGEAILSSKLAPLGTQGGLSAVIAEGKRAMTVRVNDVVGVAGFALPGNYVDVMVSTQQDRPGVKTNDEKQQISKTVLTHVLVLAVAQEAGRDDTKPKVVNAVTLELSLEDAEKLDLARNIGTLSLVLAQSDRQCQYGNVWRAQVGSVGFDRARGYSRGGQARSAARRAAGSAAIGPAG
jgi:pilus assembly protein CpaB